MGKGISDRCALKRKVTSFTTFGFASNNEILIKVGMHKNLTDPYAVSTHYVKRKRRGFYRLFDLIFTSQSTFL